MNPFYVNLLFYFFKSQIPPHYAVFWLFLKCQCWASLLGYGYVKQGNAYQEIRCGPLCGWYCLCAGTNLTLHPSFVLISASKTFCVVEGGVRGSVKAIFTGKIVGSHT